MSNFQTEIEETEHLLSIATFAGVKTLLESHLTKLKKAEAAREAQAAAAAAKAAEAASTSTSEPAKKVAKVVPSSGTYIPIESFAWDQGQYGTPLVTIFVDLDDVGTVKDKVNVTFTKSSFDLTVHDLKGKNYRLLKDNLDKDIVPEKSSFLVKKNKIVVKLQKVKGEYSYENWASLTAKKKREEVEATKKDPMGGLMDMMKNMYEEGDENMKKVIGEAMLKSRNGEKPDPASYDKMPKFPGEEDD